MSVRVQVPIRVRWADVNPAALAAAAQAMDGALQRALAQALDQIEQAVLAPRGAHARLRPQTPFFAWQDPGSQVDAPMREQVQARLAETVALLLQHRRPGRSESAANGAEVLPGRPSEALHWHRRRGLDYRVHAYNGEPSEADLALIEAAAASQGVDAFEDRFWFWDGSDDALVEHLLMVARAFHGDARSSRMGMLFRGSPGGLTGIYAASARLAWSRARPSLVTGSVRWQFLSKAFRIVQADGERARSEPPSGLYQLSNLGAYAGADALRALALPPMLAASGLGAGGEATDNETQSRLRAACLQAVERFVQDFGGDSGRVLAQLLTPLGTRYFISISPELLQGQLTLPLQGVWETVRRSGAEGGAGREGGEGGEGSDGELTGDGGNATSGEPGADGEAGQDGGRGSPLADPDAAAPDGARGRLFPMLQVGRTTLSLDLSPLLGEPHVDQLGALGQVLRRLIQRIAFRLEMPVGDHAGSFLIAAAQVVGARAALVGQAAVSLPRTTRLAEPGTGNLGEIQITLEHSPAVQLLRHVAATCPLMSELTRAMSQIYFLPEVHQQHLGRYRGRPAGWMLQFYLLYTPQMKQGVAGLFMRSCQTVMLQVLRASQAEIGMRLDHFDDYFEVFSSLITGLVAQEAELRELRDTLVQVQSALDPSLQSTVSASYASWREARRALSSRLSDQMLNAAEMFDGPDLPQGQPERRADGSWVVRDASGRAWTLHELETAIALRNGTASSIDPLVNQLTLVPEVVDVFRHRPWLARAYLRQLLTEMLANNLQVQADVSGSADYAFRSGKIREDLPNRTVPGTSVVLQGIHLLSHEAVGDAFAGDSAYAQGLDWLFGVELGRASLTSFFEFGLVISLSVLCPPAGAALGAAIAAVHVAQAEERLTIYRAVMNPEDLYNHAELELDLFMAELELVLSIIPEAGQIGRGVARAGSTLGRHGLRRGAVRLTLQARRALLQSVAQQVRQGLARAFITALVTDRAMAMVLPHVLGPVMEAVQAEIGLRTAGQPTAAAPVLAAPAAATGSSEPPADVAERPTSPEGGEFYARLDEYTPSPAEEQLPPAEEQP